MIYSVENEASRIIVFVHKRSTARMLTNALNAERDIKSAWRPALFVGHAGGTLDGMTWTEEQEPTLDSFRSGSTRLLVATNVLQEGFDVPVCDKVILFDRLLTLTGFLQSKGRARHARSQFIVICDALGNDRVAYERLVASERQLSALVGQITKQDRMRQHADDTRRLHDLVRLVHSEEAAANRQKQQQQQQQQQASKQNGPLKHQATTTTTDKHGGNKQRLKVAFQLYVRHEALDSLLRRLHSSKGFLDYDEPHSLQQQHQQLFDPADYRTLNARYEVRRGAAGTMFAFDTMRYLLGSGGGGGGGGGGETALCWLVTKSAFNAHDSSHLMCSSVHMGNLATPFEFVAFKANATNISSSSSYGESKMLIREDSQTLVLLVNIADTLHKYEMDFDAVDRILCVDMTTETTTTISVYIPLRRAPIVYKLSAEETSCPRELRNVEEEYLVWERTTWPPGYASFATCSTMRVSMKACELAKLVESLVKVSAQHNVRLVFAGVRVRGAELGDRDGFQRLRRALAHAPFDTRYALECLISQNSHLLYGKVDDELVGLISRSYSPEQSAKAYALLEKLTEQLSLRRYLDLKVRKIIAPFE